MIKRLKGLWPKIKAAATVLFIGFAGGAFGGIVQAYQAGTLKFTATSIGYVAVAGGVVAVAAIIEQYFDRRQTAFGFGALTTIVRR